MKSVGTSIDEVTYEAMLKKCNELGVNRSEYLRDLICKDLDIVEPSREKAESKNSSILDRLKQAFEIEMI